MKTEARIYSIALEQAGVKAEAAIFVDDVQVNIDACQQIGMKVVLFNYPKKAED